MPSANRTQQGVTRRTFIAAAAGAVAAPHAVSAQTAKPIKMGGPMPLTGRYSREAFYCVQGYKPLGEAHQRDGVQLRQRAPAG